MGRDVDSGDHTRRSAWSPCRWSCQMMPQSRGGDPPRHVRSRSRPADSIAARTDGGRPLQQTDFERPSPRPRPQARPPVCEWCLGSATTSKETSRCRRRENSDPGQPTVRCRKRGGSLDPATRGTGGGVVGSLHAAGPGSAASHSTTAGRAAATVQQHRQNQTRQQECKCFHVLESLVGQIHLTRNRLCS